MANKQYRSKRVFKFSPNPLTERHPKWPLLKTKMTVIQNDRCPKWPLFYTKMTVIWTKMTVISRISSNGHFGQPKVTVNRDILRPKWPFFLPKWPLLYQNDRYEPKWPLLITKMTVVVSQNDRYVQEWSFSSQNDRYLYQNDRYFLKLK